MDKFDFILPLGAVCVTAHNLRINRLQRESLPFDWIWISGLPVVSNFLATHFDGFMSKENLKFLRNNGDADIYRDTLTSVEFWHDFMVGKDFDKAYEQNYQKYCRRIARMFYHIQKAHKILLVRCVKVRPHDIPTNEDFMFETTLPPMEQLQAEFSEIQKLYPDKKIELQIFYLYNEAHEFKEYNIGTDIHICEMFNDEKVFGWQGDTTTIARVLNKYDLSFAGKWRYGINTLKFKMRKLILRLSALCGNQTSRQRLKSRD